MQCIRNVSDIKTLTDEILLLKKSVCIVRDEEKRFMSDYREGRHGYLTPLLMPPQATCADYAHVSPQAFCQTNR